MDAIIGAEGIQEEGGQEQEVGQLIAVEQQIEQENEGGAQD